MVKKSTDVHTFLEARHGPLSVISSISKTLKNTHGEFVVSSNLPFNFKRQGKKLKGYYAFGSKHILRFEFSGETLVSIGVWNTGSSLSSAPAYIVSISNGNRSSLELSTEIADAISGEKISDTADILESLISSKALREATADDIKNFVDSGGDDGGPYSQVYRKYVKWAEDNGVRVVSDVTFSEYLKKIRGGETKSSASVKVTPGIADDAEATNVEYDEFEQEILNNSVLYKYEMMAEIVKRIVTWDPLYRNAFIYGVGGVGKTFTITQVTDAYAKPGDVIVYKGAISGFTGLLQVLWQNRTRKIIIFDDNDAMLNGNPAALNLLKGAMENSDPRIISYIRFKKGAPATKKEEKGLHLDVTKLHENLVTGYLHGEKIFEETITADEKRWYEKMSSTSGRNTVREGLLDIADAEDEYADDDSFFGGDLDPNVDPAYGMAAEEAVPDQFQFTSRVIFISNLLTVPQPLMDRCISIGLLLTKKQILDLIEDKLDKIMAKEAPQVTLDTKKEVLDFMRKYVHRIGKPLTFRLFQQLCAIAHSGHPDYKKLMYLTFQGEGMKSTLR